MCTSLDAGFGRIVAPRARRFREGGVYKKPTNESEILSSKCCGTQNRNCCEMLWNSRSKNSRRSRINEHNNATLRSYTFCNTFVQHPLQYVCATPFAIRLRDVYSYACRGAGFCCLLLSGGVSHVQIVSFFFRGTLYDCLFVLTKTQLRFRIRTPFSL